ncbi:MAG TPA: hypothetical protein DEP84_31250 [Chloroflexi bacterium]|nr:hypothetical protein [Chloroflexota bacterium]
MMQRLNFLEPVLSLLGNNLDVLPAVGGAVEDLLQPDIDELEDMLINAESREVTEFLETPAPNSRDIYRPTPPIFRAQKHLYRYFIDGSLRSYYLATGVEGNRSFPIELAQIGAAVMERDDQGRVRPLARRQRILLLLPKGQLGVSDTLWRQIKQLDIPDGSFEVIDTTERNVNTPQEPTPESLRTRAGGIARNRMHRLEIEMIGDTDGLRNKDAWLILDGAVKLDQFIKTPHMIGVAKNFRKDPEFRFGRGAGKRLDITKILAGLPYASRTVAFSAHGGQVAFWYVRLREQKEVDYPLMGVVKVELPRPDRTPVDAELADLISQTLVAERNVTPYGRDNRWHCHLYPIFQAEQAIKNGFYSRDVLMGMIRWPKLQFAPSDIP